MRLKALQWPTYVPTPTFRLLELIPDYRKPTIAYVDIYLRTHMYGLYVWMNNMCFLYCLIHPLIKFFICVSGIFLKSKQPYVSQLVIDGTPISFHNTLILTILVTILIKGNKDALLLS